MRILSKLTISALGAFWVVTLFTIWKQTATTLTLGLGCAVALGVFLWVKAATWRDLRPVIILTAVYAAVAYAKLFLADTVVFRQPIVRTFVGTADVRGVFDLAFTVLLCGAIALVVARLVRPDHPGGRIRVHVVFSIVLSSIGAVLMLLEYWSFRAPFFDLAIFDQALYHLARFELPASTARQVANLWYDHQHFALVALAPLSWLKPIATHLLIVVTPFLLITLPSLLLHRIGRRFGALLGGSNDPSAYAWIIGVSSFLLWIHPATQSSIAFFFHEKYLMPIVLCLLLLALLRMLERPSMVRIGLVIVATIGWLTIKEDQWLFVTLFWVQLGIIGLIVGGTVKRTFLRVGAVCLVVCLVYGLVFLPWFQRDNDPNQGYDVLYSGSVDEFSTFLRTGNLPQLIDDWELHGDVQQYLYRTFLVFDLPGMGVFPLNIAANYGERFLSSMYSQRNPIFHHGVDAPIYTVIGVIGLMLILHHKRGWAIRRQAVFVIVLSVLGFGSILGWNSTYYLYARWPSIVAQYRETAPWRSELAVIRPLIPSNASLVSTEVLSTHFSQRDQIALFPDRLHLPDDDPGKAHVETYDYWILRRDVTDDAAKADALVQSGYAVRYEGETFLVLQKPSS